MVRDPQPIRSGASPPPNPRRSRETSFWSTRGVTADGSRSAEQALRVSTWWQGAGDGEALFAGIDVSASYVWLEGLTLRDQPYALMSKNAPTGVVISRNTFLAAPVGNGRLELFVTHRFSRRSVSRTVDGALRHEHPAPALPLVNALVPDGEPGPIWVTAPQRCRVAAERDGDVAVHLGLLRVEVPLEILRGS